MKAIKYLTGAFDGVGSTKHFIFNDGAECSYWSNDGYYRSKFSKYSLSQWNKLTDEFVVILKKFLPMEVNYVGTEKRTEADLSFEEIETIKQFCSEVCSWQEYLNHKYKSNYISV